jgi:translation elongation factor EF-G
MNEAERTEKLQRLKSTAEGAERQSLALELSDTRDPGLFEIVVALIQRSGLQPIMKVEVVTPEDYLGDVISDLHSRRGQILGTETQGSAQLVEAMVPFANMFAYADALRSCSEGRAHFTMQFSHYDDGPNNGGPPDTEPAAAALSA